MSLTPPSSVSSPSSTNEHRAGSPPTNEHRPMCPPPEAEEDFDRLSFASCTSTVHPMHEVIFADDVAALAKLLKEGETESSHPSYKKLIDSQDAHGNTPLHLAVMLGHHNCVALLISANATVKTKNKAGWSAMNEAVSYGDRITVSALLRLFKNQSRDNLKIRKPHVISMLQQLDDFYLELKWEFHSWIPLISRVLPSDVCKIYKKGASIRFDTTLVDFTEHLWERGDVSFIFNPDAKKVDDQLVMLDNKAKCYQRVKYKKDDEEKELNEEVNLVMSSDILNVQMTTKTVVFNRQMAGWIFKQERTMTIGDYSSDVYTVEGMCIVSRKRREHLSADDLKKNKNLLTNFQSGKLSDDDIENADTKQRASIAPPIPMAGLSFEDYLAADSDDCIGRQRVTKTSKKHVKAYASMSTDFPLEIETLLDVFEIVAPLKHIEKLRKFCQLRMPPGFPIHLEIPIFPTVTAQITFQHMQFRDDIDPRLFDIPKEYKLTKKRFPNM